MSYTVMVVDDSPTELKLMAGKLSDAGYQVLMQTDAERAIDEAKKGGAQLILMDVVMPGLNGFQATRTLKRDRLTADIPIIVVSSKSQETDKLWALRQGAADYLVKPISTEHLIHAVQKAIDES